MASERGAVGTRRTTRVALFGSSCDPPTNETGHLGLVQYLRERFDLVWILPVFEHPFSYGESKGGVPADGLVESVVDRYSTNGKEILDETNQQGVSESDPEMLRSISVGPSSLLNTFDSSSSSSSSTVATRPAVSPQPKKKSKRCVASYEHRLAMTRLMCERYEASLVARGDSHNDKKLLVSTAEKDFYDYRKSRGMSTAFGTYDLIEYLRLQNPHHEYFLVLGSDTLRDLLEGRWRRWEEMLNTVCICAIRRPITAQNEHDDSDLVEMIETMKDKVKGVAFFEVPWLGPTSSSFVRGALREYWGMKKRRDDAEKDDTSIRNSDASPPALAQNDVQLKEIESQILERVTGEVFEYILAHELYGKL